ncbi:hypothetical protein OBBRIDRAFT_725683 [Obba rivulosa]|uniref:Uncharacterized protein n=1 Tax=Obba rivulosa TaxID=1052685 RepID=A0A8E2B3I4_9APHY|nr:hypothetical protein OBBRIDRAFT_725683 [Obba rivulosa]
MRLVPNTVWIACLLVARTIPVVLANTEIVNFAAEEAPDTPGVPVLRPGAAEVLWRLQPAPLGTPLDNICQHTNPAGSCPHELWLSLDLDSREWRSYGRFTLRVSWPASSPADFSIDIHSPREVAMLLGHTESASKPPEGKSPLTRRKVARIRLVDTGVRTPRNSSRLESAGSDPVPFIVLLEPLYLGVLPASVLPIVLFIAVVATVASVVVFPTVYHRLRTVAGQAQAELSRHKRE